MKSRKSRTKRGVALILAAMLCVSLCVSLMPTNVLAARETTPDDEDEEISALSVGPEIDEMEGSVDETETEAVLPENTTEVTSEEKSVPEDDAGEEIKALTGGGSFLYEDSDLMLKVTVSGNVDVPDAEEEISWDDVTMKASVLGKDSDTYSQMESYAEEGSGDLGILIVAYKTDYNLFNCILLYNPNIHILNQKNVKTLTCLVTKWLH